MHAQYTDNMERKMNKSQETRHAMMCIHAMKHAMKFMHAIMACLSNSRMPSNSSNNNNNNSDNIYAMICIHEFQHILLRMSIYARVRDRECRHAYMQRNTRTAKRPNMP